MPRCYIFATKAQAQACVDRINLRARTVYGAQGYQLDAAGAIIGTNAATGTPMPDATKTTTWDIPRQRVDGKWAVRHCEAVPGNNFVLDATKIPPLTVAAFVAQDIAAGVSVETEDVSWWPVPPKMQVGV